MPVIGDPFQLLVAGVLEHESRAHGQIDHRSSVRRH
jgi:hypothetical protein